MYVKKEFRFSKIRCKILEVAMATLSDSIMMNFGWLKSNVPSLRIKQRRHVCLFWLLQSQVFRQLRFGIPNSIKF